MGWEKGREEKGFLGITSTFTFGSFASYYDGEEGKDGEAFFLLVVVEKKGGKKERKAARRGEAQGERKERKERKCSCAAG